MENSVLTFKEYDIAGNLFRAYYDADEKLVFVLDSTLNESKPNSLLVINPVGDRKWDDILANDYSVDLETVRPKKDNKYQKLDIEYSGLSEYDNLIKAYDSGDDLAAALSALDSFREESVRRAATERLSVAESNAEKARETITKTKESIEEMQVKLRQLRTKLSQQKKQIGREPTKKSASKILRTDAQIDATNEKLRRAKRRLDNAQRRLIIADEDAEKAREILERKPMSVVTSKEVAMPRHSAIISNNSSKSLNVAASSRNDDNVAQTIDPSDDYDESIDFIEEENIQNEQKAELMAEEPKKEEVKPLFDTDPEILDEEIAFKPIDFGASSPVESNPVSEKPEIYENVIEDKPLSFTPPESSRPAPINVVPVREDAEEQNTNIETPPVLDTIKSVEVPVQNSSTLDSLNSESGFEVSPKVPDVESRPVQDLSNNRNVENTMTRPVPPAATLSGAASARPVSPITGSDTPTNPAPHKPTFVYYVMLVLLIALSIFTLWLYQKNTSEKVPDLTTTVSTPEVVVEETTSDADLDSPFIPVLEPADVESDSVIEVQSEEQVVPVVEDIPEIEPEPVIEEIEAPMPVIEPEPVEPAPVADVVVETMVSTAPVIEEPAPVIPTEEEILASKPSYNVSQNENMFVAAPEYDTETVYNNTDEVVSEDLPMCPDGTAPDINGCCSGEVYTDMGEMGFNCCPQEGGDCFPPLL